MASVTQRFTTSADWAEDWIVYHGMRDYENGCLPGGKSVLYQLSSPNDLRTVLHHFGCKMSDPFSFLIVPPQSTVKSWLAQCCPSRKSFDKRGMMPSQSCIANV